MPSNVMDATATVAVPPPPRPMTGAEYLESLRDGREIWLYGERVKDVTTHPAFRNTARMVARLYDALHDPTLKDVLTTETDTGSGGYTHRYFRAPMTWEEQLAGARRHRRLGALDLRLAGARARTTKAAFLGTLGANAGVLHAVRGQRPGLVQEGPGTGPLPQPRHHPPARGSGSCPSTSAPRSACTRRGRRTAASLSAAPRSWRPARR